jgi:class 3 adenylate cyclase/tetratricopeptide (TPR) repeat protein
VSNAGVSSCIHCGFPIEEAARFCGGCGRLTKPPSPIGAQPYTFLQSNVPAGLLERVTRSGGLPLGERKHVTVLFADIRGSTALIEKLDPEEALELLGPVLKVLMDAVHEHDGFVNQTRGDGIMALFGAPIASEEHAVQACRAALAMRAAAAALSLRRSVSIRIGINSGQVVIHSIGSNVTMTYGAVGKTVHLAARMEELAAPGTILLSAATRDLAKGNIAAVSKGSALVKGLEESVDIFELLAMRTRTRWQVRSSRGLSELVGRQTEVDVLRESLNKAAEGQGRAVTVVASAGLGKSRLIHEFLKNVPDEWWVLETACVSQRTHSSYYPVSTLIRAIFHVGTEDSPDLVQRLVKEGIERLDKGLLAILPAILSLLDLPSNAPNWNKLEPSEKRKKVSEAVETLVFDQHRSRPLMIVVEDVHWADALTIQLLNSVIGALPGTRTLIVVTQRPEATWIDQMAVRLDLEPLNDTACNQMIDAIVGNDVSLLQIKKVIAAQAEGNPLFIEELIQSLRDRKILQGELGKYTAIKSSERLEIPETIHSVLATRIDLLEAVPKATLQTAAVIGTNIDLPLLSAITGIAPGELAAHLRTLEAADLIRHISIRESGEYSFKHDLVREVAYGTMLVGHRRSLHGKVVDIIESHFADRIDEHIDRLADHAFLAELWDKAVPYQLRSCRRAAKRGAYQDVISVFDRARETLSHLPPGAAKIKAEIDFRLIVIIALEPLGRHRRIAQVLEEARILAEQSDDPWRTAAVNCQLSVALWRLGKHEGALRAAEAASAIANGIKDRALIFASLHNIGIVHHETGAFEKAVEVHEQCLAIETPELDQKRAGWAALPSVVLRTFLADSLIDLGELKRAEIIAEEASHRAEKADHAYSRANINHVLARLRLAQGRYTEALPVLRESWKACLDLEMVQMYPIFAARMGEAYLATGELEAALEIVAMPEKLDVPLAEHAFGWRYLFLAQARIFLAFGRHQDARVAAERALNLAKERGEPPQEAHAAKVLGDIAAAASDPAEAKNFYDTAFALAKTCSMLPLMKACAEAVTNLAAARTKQPPHHYRALAPHIEP